MDTRTIFQHVRDPASAAIAGIVFSVILIVVLAQFHAAVPAGSATTDWLYDSSRRGGVQVAVGLIPFAGIAFLWFIGVIRTRLGDSEDKLFATVFLGSGLLFVAVLFFAGSILATLLTLYSRGIGVDADAMVLLTVLTKSMMGMFGFRMAAVFTLSVTSLGFRSGLLPGWLVGLGYLTAVVLLLSPPVSPWSQLLFPAWVLAFSVHMLVVRRAPAAD